MYSFARNDVCLPDDIDTIDCYIGTDCYFGNNIEQLKRAIQFKRKAIFKGISKTDKEYCYVTQGRRAYKMFLPCEKVTVFDDNSVFVK